MTKMFFSLFLALFYSIAYIVIGPMIAPQDVKFDSSRLFPFILCFLLCSVVNYFIFSVIPQLHLRIKNGRIAQYLDRVGDRKLFLITWAFIFVSWIPAYLIFYPGVLSYDIRSQVSSALGTIVNNHHPVLHTWLIRFFMKLGYALLSDYEFGLGLLSLLQMLLLSYALTRLVFLLRKKKVPVLIVILTALLSAIWFMNACLSVTMVKDTLHAAFLVLFACHFTEIVTDLPAYSLRKQNLFILPVISFLMCALRNNGIHIYIFCFAVLFILRIPRIKKAKAYIALTVAILLPVLMYKIYTGPVFDALGIAPTEIQEAFSIPIQQLQRVAFAEADELTSEQAELITYYITDLKWMDPPPERYNPYFADPAKGCFVTVRYNDDPIAFWKLYLQIGKQFPKVYVSAFLSNTLGYWYPGYYEFSYVPYEDFPPEMFVVPLERKSIWDSQVLKKYYESVCCSDFWRETPVLRLFFIPGFALWILLYALALAWKKRVFFTKVLPIFLPLIAQFGIMLLSPMSSFRYSWPFYLMLPLAFIGIWGDWEPKMSDNERTNE